MEWKKTDECRPNPYKPLQLQRILGGQPRSPLKTMNLEFGSMHLPQRPGTAAGLRPVDKENLTDSSSLASASSKSLDSSAKFEGCLGPEVTSTPFSHPDPVQESPAEGGSAEQGDQQHQNCSADKFKTPKRTFFFKPTKCQSPATPGSSCSRRAPSSGGSSRTPSSGSSIGSLGRSGSSRRFNPFDSHHSTDVLHLPTLSPSVFATVVSPSQEESCSSQFWSIEQQAELYPVPISEESPLRQSLYIRGHDSELEDKAQRQIDIYFEEHHSITSPPDLPPTGPLIQETPPDKENSYVLPERADGMANKWCQTALSFPSVLPPAVEEILKKYMSQDTADSMPCDEQQGNLSNSTLRRKLFNCEFNDDDCSDDHHNSTDSEDDESCRPSATVANELTPGRVIHTPVSVKNIGDLAQWSSSPVRASHIRTSHSPPGHLGSPILSPIGQKKSSAGGSEDNFGEEACGDDTQAGDVETCATETSDLWLTAKLEENETSQCSDMRMETDSQPPPAAAASHTQPSLGWQSHSNFSLSLPAQEESSAADAGYATNSRGEAASTGVSYNSLSQVDMDSGLLSLQKENLTASVIVPGGLLRPEGSVMMSYAYNANDISVGFPLGSSTPTKK